MLVVAGESIDGILREGRYEQLLAGSFVSLPSGCLICSVVNKRATVSNDDNSRAQTVGPGVYEVAAFRRSGELIDANLRAEIGQDDLSFLDRARKLTRLGCLLTFCAPVLGIGFFAATFLGMDATLAKSGVWLLLLSVAIFWSLIAIVRRSSRWNDIALRRNKLLQKYPELIISLASCDRSDVPPGAVSPFIDLTVARPAKQTESTDLD